MRTHKHGPGFRVLSLESRVPGPERETQDSKHKTQDRNNKTLNPKPKTLKGQMFTADSMLAVLLVLLFATMVLGTSLEQASLRSESSKERFAEDALIALDRSGDLATLNATRISGTISALASPGLNWSLNITTYRVNGGSLQQIYSVKFGYNASEGADILASQRRFASYSQNGIANVSVARMEVW